MFNPDQNRLAPTLAMIMAASLVGFITGYTVPLISLELAQQQIAPLYVGLLAALPPAGMMISSFLSPALCRRVEMLASGVFCFAFFDASILALLPLYGMDKGLNEGLAVLLVTVVLTGDAMFQTPLGWLADRVGIRRVHLSCAVVFSLSLLALPLMLGSRIQLMAICLLLGAAAGALYTLSLVRAGKTFNGQKLIMINALFGFFWSAGSVAGPVVSGMLIGITGYDGLIVTLVASGVLFLLIQCLCKNEKTLLASEQEDDMDEATESAR